MARKRSQSRHKKALVIPDESVPFLTVGQVGQVAHLLQLSRKTVYRRAQKGLYAYFRDDSGQLRFYRASFESHIAARSVGVEKSVVLGDQNVYHSTKKQHGNIHSRASVLTI
jgi:hypothetical protein